VVWISPGTSFPSIAWVEVVQVNESTWEKSPVVSVCAATLPQAAISAAPAIIAQTSVAGFVFIHLRC
jgi:hypothetical protein